MKNNTAIATTATADGVPPGGVRSRDAPVVGRFAPSPTGPLHEGSLLAAVGSYLQARVAGGRWLLRIEDVDTTRRRPQAETQILQALELFGFEWDGPVLRQSTRVARYQDALDALDAKQLLFRCACTRRERTDAGAEDLLGCVAHCAERQHAIDPAHCCLRLRVELNAPIEFDDLWQGHQRCGPSQCVDVVLRRRDRLHAYQLAVVVDDADQGVTEVIRGADLLSSTGTQILLQQALSLPRPRYGHLPLLVEADGGKLSKSRHATPLATDAASRSLIVALERLRQHPPPSLRGAPVREIWQWASANWQPNALAGLRRVNLDTVAV